MTKPVLLLLGLVISTALAAPSLEKRAVVRTQVETHVRPVSAVRKRAGAAPLYDSAVGTFAITPLENAGKSSTVPANAGWTSRLFAVEATAVPPKDGVETPIATAAVRKVFASQTWVFAGRPLPTFQPPPSAPSAVPVLQPAATVPVAVKKDGVVPPTAIVPFNRAFATQALV
ncbi:hypothetical protein HK104_009819, partial [Borealophlyctis nickersoniae]